MTISHVGATPVFVDIEPDYFTIDPKAIAGAITPRTKAIIPVHLYGQAAAMDEIMTLANRHDLLVLEDVAQAFGASYKGRKLGVIGNIGAYSFFPSKNLGAYGDGGLLTTDDDKLAAHARMLRAHGAKKKYYNEILGYNSRLDALQAAILRVKLPHLEAWNRGRHQAAQRYRELLKGTSAIVTPRERADAAHVFHQYTVRVTSDRRDWLQKKLEEHGIGTMIYYPVPVHQLPIYADHHKCQLPVTEQAAREALSLPIWPQITLETQTQVVQTIVDCFA